MTKQDRTTLKSFFRKGALPTAEHYRDLIDSSVNHVDDGFSKTDSDGLKLKSAGSSLRVLSLYQGLGTPKPSWIIEHGNAPGTLHFRPDLGKSALVVPDAEKEAEKERARWARKRAAERAKDPALVQIDAEKKARNPNKVTAPNDEYDDEDDEEEVLARGLCMTRDGRIGVNTDTPQWRLDVGGVARMSGRIGVTSQKIPHVPADGKWHDITQPMTGCQAFEVTAGAGGDRLKGRYSMLHAIAMNAFHPRNPILNWFFGRRAIRTQTAMYGSYSDRLRLRWRKTDEPHYFTLQLRSNADFGDDKVVRYYLTRLWFDSVMEGSRKFDAVVEGPDKGIDRDKNLL